MATARVSQRQSGSSLASACAAAVHTAEGKAYLNPRVAGRPAMRFTSTEVVYGVTGTDVTELPEYGVSP